MHKHWLVFLSVSGLEKPSPRCWILHFHPSARLLYCNHPTVLQAPCCSRSSLQHTNSLQTHTHIKVTSHQSKMDSTAYFSLLPVCRRDQYHAAKGGSSRRRRHEGGNGENDFRRIKGAFGMNMRHPARSEMTQAVTALSSKKNVTLQLY